MVEGGGAIGGGLLSSCSLWSAGLGFARFVELVKEARLVLLCESAFGEVFIALVVSQRHGCLRSGRG